MIKKSVMIIFVLMIAGAPLRGWQWSQPIAVSGGNTPDMDIDKKTGNVFVLTMINGVNITVFDKDGNFISQENVPGTSGDKGNENGFSFGATISVDNEGFPHICYRKMNYDIHWDHYSTYYKRKSNSGWENKITLIHGPRASMVRVKIDMSNNVHIVNGYGNYYLELVGEITYIKLWYGKRLEFKLDLGASNLVYRTDTNLEIDCYGTEHVHVISGVPNPTGELYYVYSSDGGDKFSVAENIRQGTNESRCGSPDLQVDGNGFVHLCYGESDDELIHGKPSVHYARIENFVKVMDDVVTAEDELVPWPSSLKIGIGSIGCSDDGQRLVLAYVEQPGGPLYARYSLNMGETWSEPTQLATSCGGYDGRDKQIVRGNGNSFYLAYSSEGNVWLRQLTLDPNQPPIADAGGPYNSDEGAAITFDASASVDSDGAIVQYTWDWNNDGLFDDTTNTATISHSYPDDYSGQLALCVTDDKGGADTTYAEVVVTNVPPIANANGPYSADKNTDLILTGSAIDPGTLDSLSYAWDLDTDGVYEAAGQTVTTRFATGGAHEIRLCVRDDDGGEDFDTTLVQIRNEPPVVGVIPGQQIDEGGVFNPINLDDYVHDADNVDSELSWSVADQKHLLVSITDRVAQSSVIDSNWYGADTITFKVTDPGNLCDEAAVIFTVSNVNDAPVLAQIPAQIKQEGDAFDPIDVDAYVADIDNAVNELAWTISGQAELSYEWNGHVLQVLTPDENWYGSEHVLFTVTDPGGLSDTQQVQLTMQEVNDPPVISGFVDQQIDYAAEFTPIELDSMVTDPDHNVHQLQWSVLPTIFLTVTIDPARIAVITRNQPNWSGSEVATFVVSDGSSSDSADVRFTVGDQPQPPVISAIPPQIVTENHPFQPLYLDGYVSDPDHSDRDLNWQVVASELLVTETDRVLSVAVPDSEWAGSDTLVFIVTDPSGLTDTTTAVFSVIAVNDSPQPFALIRPVYQTYSIMPDSIGFIWHCSNDPDHDDQVCYELRLSDVSNFSHVMEQYSQLTDTSFVYYPSTNLDAGNYYWQITACDQHNATVRSEVGSFTIEYTAVMDTENHRQPISWRLEQNYPNPFNPVTTIRFDLPVSGQTTLKVFDLMGREVATLIDGFTDAGSHQVQFDASDIVSGIYYVRLSSGNFHAMKKIALVR